MTATDNTTNQPLKRCILCGRLLTLSNFVHDKHSRDGLTSRCKPCRKIRLPKPPPVPDGMRRCTKCNEIKPASTEYFPRDKSRKSGLSERCNKCNYLKAAQWARENPDRARENGRRNTARTRARYPERIREQGRKSAARRKDKAALIRRSPHGKAINKAIKQRRRAREIMLPARFTPDDWRRALDYFNGCCAVCGRPPGFWHTIAADHWIPINDIEHCPGTVATNIVPLCHGQGGCNNSKGHRNPHEWLTERYGIHKARRIEARILGFFNTVSQQCS